MVKAVGHRGAAGVLPENTLQGFRYALDLGVDAVECDVHLSRDGHLILMHDEKVDRTTNGTGRLAEMDFAEIRALDAGGGQTVPTLEELLELVRGRCELLCELKADAATAPAARAVKASGMGGQVLFISFSLPRLAEVKRHGAGLQVGALLSGPNARHLDRALELGVRHVGVHYRSLTAATVERAKEAGVEIGAWTPNELGEMKAMIALGVDCLTTDRPDVLMEYLAKAEGGPGA